jgi:hypothetical protein
MREDNSSPEICTLDDALQCTVLTKQNAKILKSTKEGWITAGVHLLPNDLGGTNLCPYSTPTCRHICLHYTGRNMIFKRVTRARTRRTFLFNTHPEIFESRLHAALYETLRECKRKNFGLALRPNLTSDSHKLVKMFLRWKDNVSEHTEVPIRIYDYTKIPKAQGWFPEDYVTVYSWGELTTEEVFYENIECRSVAAVFAKGFPDRFKGYPVISGEDHDLRFLDARPGVIIAIKARGRAFQDTSGFVVDLTE